MEDVLEVYTRPYDPRRPQIRGLLLVVLMFTPATPAAAQTAPVQQGCRYIREQTLSHTQVECEKGMGYTVDDHGTLGDRLPGGVELPRPSGLWHAKAPNSCRNSCRFRLAAFVVSMKTTNEEHVSTLSANAASLSANLPADTATGAFSWGRYARIGLLTIGAAVLANAVFFYLAQLGMQYDPAFLPLGNVSAPIIFTVFPAVVAAVLYAGLLQFVRKHAALVFTMISAITFVVTLIPDVTYIPTLDGVSNAEVGVLVAMHTIAAAVITRGLTSIRR
jgi:hypothetical protein